jgi:DNA-binding beta-propeller fold protein YncE
VSAASILLDRGWGKPTEPHTGEDDKDIHVTIRNIVEERRKEQQTTGVVIAPDGKRAFVCLNLVHKIGVLAIDGQNVTYDKSMDIPSAFNPYNINFTPDGKYVVASNIGAQKNNADAAIAPDGKTAATPLLLGTAAKDSDWFKTKTGELVLMSIGTDGKLTVTARAPLGGLPEGIAYSPNSDYLYVGNYFDRDLQVFHISSARGTSSLASALAAA